MELTRRRPGPLGPDSMLVLLLASVVLMLINIATAVAAAPTSPSTANITCNIKNNVKLDRDLARLLVFSEKYGRDYPEDRQQLKEFCRESTALLTSIDGYKNKCLKGQFKQFASLFIYSNRNTIKRFCGKSSANSRNKLAEYLKLAPCVNRNKKPFNKCMIKLIETMVGIKYAENKKKIPHLCCTVVSLIECFNNEVQKTECADKGDLMMEFVRNLVSNGNLDATCGEYNEDTDRCSKLGKPPSKKPTDKTPDSILFPFYDVIRSLPED